MKQKWSPSEEIDNNWESISIDAYKFILEKATIKNDEILANSEVITERTIKIFSVFIAVILMLCASSYKKVPDTRQLVGIVILCLTDLYVFQKLLFGARLRTKGTEARTMLNDNLVTKYKDRQLVNLYYDEIVRTQRSIDWNRETVNTRRKYYFTTIIITSIVVGMALATILGNVQEINHLL